MIKEEYDVIVIGAGIGGLACASLLAKAGMQVLVVEQSSRPGGYVGSFKKKGFTFDCAAHFVTGCHKNGVIGKLLRELKVEREIKFIKVKAPVRFIFPDFEFSFSLNDLEGAERIIKERFPQEAKNLDRYKETLDRIGQEIIKVGSSFSIWKMSFFPLLFPSLFKYRNYTVRKLMDEHFTDERLKTILSISPVTVPPSKASLLMAAVLKVESQEAGIYYPKGGMQSFTNVLVRGLKKYKGELLLNTLITKILIDKGKVQGVKLADGRRIKATYVISNASLQQTFYKLVGKKYLKKRFIKKIEGKELSLSCFILYLGIDMDLKSLDLNFRINVYPTYNTEKQYEILKGGEIPEEFAFVMTFFSLIDPITAPKGKHALIITTAAPYHYHKDWGTGDGGEVEYRRLKENIIKRMVEKAEKIIPDLSFHIIYQGAATPLTLERETLNTQGAIYGLAATPKQIGPGRFKNRTPIKGLYLVGHYTYVAHGIGAVTHSARAVANMIVKREERR
ncbi:4,4'-diapophytoene desaturase (4,4'-diapolycopene-forming) [subsurface metagenome]